MRIAVFFYELGLALWLGQIVCFTFVLVPAVFHALSREQADLLITRVQRAFLRYGLICGFVALMMNAILTVQAMRTGAGYYTLRELLIAAVLLVLMLALAAYSRFVLLPRIERTEDAAVETQNHAIGQRAEALNRAVLVINGTVLLLGLIVFFLAVTQVDSPGTP